MPERASSIRRETFVTRKPSAFSEEEVAKIPCMQSDILVELPDGRLWWPFIVVFKDGRRQCITRDGRSWKQYYEDKARGIETGRKLKDVKGLKEDEAVKTIKEDEEVKREE